MEWRAIKKSLGVKGKQEGAPLVVWCSVVCVWVLYTYKTEEKRNPGELL